MSKKAKAVYNLEDDTVVIKIDAKTNDCCCNPNEKQMTLKKNVKIPNQQQVYQQNTNNRAFKLPFRQDTQQVYPISVTVEQVGKSRRSSSSSESSSRGSKNSGSYGYDGQSQKLSSSLRSESPRTTRRPGIDDDEPDYIVNNEYDLNSGSISSKSTKNSFISNPREQIYAITEERPSFFDGEENILATPVTGLARTTEVDLSVSNIEIAHYPFKYSARSQSMVTSPSTPRSSKDSDNSNRLPFKTETQPIMMRASVAEEDAISPTNSESTISVLDINNYPLPIQPRDHGQHCAIEVNVLEKHKLGCTNKKEMAGKSIEDQVGSYDVVSRVVYRTCGADKEVIKSTIRNSLKSYRINKEEFFGKDLQESRSRVETIPILPNYKCVLNAEFPKPEKTIGKITGIRKNSADSTYESEPIVNLTTFQPPPEVLSVYIRTDRNERVPEGFQKMHYRGDSCKLHDPEERTKQILQLQKVIEETSSEAYLSKSPRQFSESNEPAQVLAATTIADNPIPMHAAVKPEVVEIEDSEDDNTYDGDDSTVSLTEKDNLYSDSLDKLPISNRRGNDEIVRVGLFNCFRRNKQKRQREESIEFVRDLSGKRVTHSNNQPRRHNEEDEAPRKLSATYKRK